MKASRTGLPQQARDIKQSERVVGHCGSDMAPTSAGVPGAGLGAKVRN